MPWHIVDYHSECPARRPAAVVKDADGKVVGCHRSRSAAKMQLAVLYGAEEGDEGASSDGVMMTRREA